MTYLPEILCGDFERVETPGLQLQQESAHIGSAITFWCEEGLTLVQNGSVRCGMEGKWMGIVPHCDGKFINPCIRYVVSHMKI